VNGCRGPFTPPHRSMHHSPPSKLIERGHILTVLQQTHLVIVGPCRAAWLLGPHSNTLRRRLISLASQAQPTNPRGGHGIS
jgi:hypothetical protein